MKILFVENNDMTFFSFRRELFELLITKGHKVVLVGNFTDKVVKNVGGKAEIVLIKSDLKSKNPFSNLCYLSKITKIIKNVQPDIMLTFTIKPNLYCNWKKHKFPSIANITGLGKTFQNKGLLNSIVIFLYKRCFKNVNTVFFQNLNGYQVFKQRMVPINSFKIIPGSGINTNKFLYEEQKSHIGTRFLYASRFIKEKGFDLMIKAIPAIVDEYPSTHFTFLGKSTKASQKAYKMLLEKGYQKNVEFLPFSDDMVEMYKKADFLVSPSFYKEGISNVLLESLAVGRPIITTNDNPGCSDVLVEDKNGYGVSSNNLDSLISALRKAIRTNDEMRKQMGIFGRKFVDEKFNRNITNQIYLKTIDELENTD